MAIFTEEEWSKVRNKKDFTRAKGLGQYSVAAVKEALFGDSKRWEQLYVKDWKKFSDKVELLMGDSVDGRRELLFDRVDFEKIKFM